MVWEAGGRSVQGEPERPCPRRFADGPTDRRLFHDESQRGSSSPGSSDDVHSCTNERKSDKSREHLRWSQSDEGSQGGISTCETDSLSTDCRLRRVAGNVF